MRRFTLLALAVAVLLGVALSPFASGSPDGLERVAADRGFLGEGRLHAVQESAPVPGYAFPGVHDARFATALAGLAGTVGVFALGGGVLLVAATPATGGAGVMSGMHAVAAAGLAGDPASPVHRLDARAKLLGLAGLTCVAATAPATAWPLLAACAAVLATVAAAARVPARVVWRRARVVLPLVLLAAASMPFVRHGGAVHRLGPLAVHDAGLTVFAAAAGKAVVGTVSAVLLASTTTVTAALEGLRRLRAPAVLVAIAGVTWRYVFVLTGELARMRIALAARGHRPRHLLQAAALGQLATALFLRAHARGERVHVAMAARGWTGDAGRRPARAASRGPTSLFAAGVAGLPLALRVALELGA